MNDVNHTESPAAVQWTQENHDKEVRPKRSVREAMIKGARLRCPCCGKGHLFSRYLRVVDACYVCGQELHHHRADDAPPYFTMLIVGHIVVALLMSVELHYAPAMWVHLIVWLPLTIALSLLLLPRIKGAIVGLQWALFMHGFGETVDEERLARMENVS